MDEARSLVRNPERAASMLIETVTEVYQAYAKPGQTLEVEAWISIRMPPAVAAALYRRMTLELEDVCSVDRVCRVCGCTDAYACDEGCEWVDADLCSNCEDQPA